MNMSLHVQLLPAPPCKHRPNMSARGKREVENGRCNINVVQLEGLVSMEGQVQDYREPITLQGSLRRGVNWAS